MPFTGRLVDRYSSQTVSRASTTLCLGGWAIVPLAGSVPVLALMMLLTGLGTGVGDVAMNVQGHLVEQRSRHVLMPFWHGIFSLGAVAGALAGALAASLGLPVAWQLPVVSLILAVAMWLATGLYIPDAGLHPANQEPIDRPIFDEPQVIASDQEPSPHCGCHQSPGWSCCGLIVFATAVGEGALNDWLALMLVDNRAAPPAVSFFTYAGFNLTMTIGRFMAGIIQRFGRCGALRGGRDRQRGSGDALPGAFDRGRVNQRRGAGPRVVRGIPVGDVCSGRGAWARRGRAIAWFQRSDTAAFSSAPL
jgi:MFS family permease